MILKNTTEQNKCMKLMKENVYKEMNKKHVNMDIQQYIQINEYYVKQIVNSMERILSDETINNKE